MTQSAPDAHFDTPIKCLSLIKECANPRFVYGGVLETRTSYVYSDVHVLSIPGFVWFKSADSPAVPRYAHTCEYVQGGQMMSIGGIDNPSSELDVRSNQASPDPFLQGIGIFDMTNMRWKSSYDADSPSYESPQPVKEWYSAG